MTLQQLRDFLCVAEHGSFRAAARALGVSQAGLTHSVQALEASVGSQLFQRSGRGVALTPAGQALGQRARLIDAEARRAQAELRQMNDGLTGSVRVGLSPTASSLLLADVVTGFRAHYPGAELRLSEGLYERLVPEVLQGQADFAVLSLSGAPAGRELAAQPLLQSAMAIVGRRGHPAARAGRLAGLAAVPWVLMGPAGTPGATVLRYFEQAGLPPPPVAVTCETLMQVAALLQGTDYLALLPRLALDRGLLPASLVEVKVAEPPLRYDLFLVQRGAVPLTPLAARLARMFATAARRLAPPAPA